MNFIVQIQDWNWSDDDEGMNISAGDFHQAAEVACEFMDRKGDYTVLRGAMPDVRVRLEGEKEWRTFIVSAESIPHYRARLKNSRHPPITIVKNGTEIP